MAETKILAWVAALIGIPLYGWAIWENLTTWKSDVLFASALIFLWVRAWFYIKKNNKALRKEDQEARIRDLEIKQLEKKYNDKQG